MQRKHISSAIILLFLVVSRAEKGFAINPEPQGMPKLRDLGVEMGWSLELSCAPSLPPDSEQARQWRATQIDPTRAIWIYLGANRDTQAWCGIGVEGSVCESLRSLEIPESLRNSCNAGELAEVLRNRFLSEAELPGNRTENWRNSAGEAFLQILWWITLSVVGLIGLTGVMTLYVWYQRQPTVVEFSQKANAYIERTLSYRQYLSVRLSCARSELSQRLFRRVPSFHSGGGSLSTQRPLSHEK